MKNINDLIETTRLVQQYERQCKMVDEKDIISFRGKAGRSNDDIIEIARKYSELANADCIEYYSKAAEETKQILKSKGYDVEIKRVLPHE